MPLASLTTSDAVCDTTTRVPSGCGENRSSTASGLLDNPQMGCLRRPSLQPTGFGRNAARASFEIDSKRRSVYVADCRLHCR